MVLGAAVWPESEHDFQPKLNIAVLGRQRLYVSKCAGAECRHWIAEARRILEVEKLGAELQLHPLPDREVLHCGEIQVEQPRSVQKVATRITVHVNGRWRQCKRTAI